VWRATRTLPFLAKPGKRVDGARAVMAASSASAWLMQHDQV
jgi:hypothetical protein